MTKLKLGKYEFSPYEDEWEKRLKELKKSSLTDKERKKSLEEILEGFLERKKKSAKKK